MAPRTESKSAEMELRNKPFRFFDLPPEIRIAFLKYTDLVTPGCEVEWRNNKGFSIIFRRANHKDELLSLIDEPWAQRLLYSKQFRICAATEVENHKSADLCTYIQGAHSDRCKCWAPPTSLMLVSRGFYACAIHVFYSCNRIALLSRGFVTAEHNFPNLDPIPFIMRPTGIRYLEHLRTIEIVIPRLQEEYDLRRCNSLYLDWVASIEHLKVYANLPALTLILYADPPLETTEQALPGEDTTKHILEMLKGPHLADYYKFIIPLRALSGLKRLFIHLVWWWHWSPDHGESVESLYAELPWVTTGSNDISLEHESIAQWEATLERLVMGDDYDSMAVGKADEIPSEWMTADFCSENDELAYILQES